MISVNSPHNTYDNLFIANYADIFIKDEIARIKGVSVENVVEQTEKNAKKLYDL